MSELSDIRQALADALSAALGTAFQVSAYMLANPTYPFVHVFPSEVGYHMTMSDGLASWRFTVRALAAITTDIGAQQTLDAMLGETGDHSVKAALEADTKLGGACDNLIVRSASNYTSYVVAGGSQVVGVDWTVEVYR